jgi:nicotinamidase-related amidase
MPSKHKRPGSSAARRTSTFTIPVRGTALLLIDVINDMAFEGSEDLIEQAEPMAARLVELKRRATAAGIPAIYVNDNFASPGHRVSRRLRPTSRDYFVLKPKHSGFYDTTLDTLLQSLGVKRVIVTGIAGNICVLFTANDAYMRGLRIVAPHDCIVSNTAEDNAYALRQIEIILKGRVESSDRLRFRGTGDNKRRRSGPGALVA